MSGEMNTSLGNGFSNLMFMLYACEIQGIECDGIVEGDDGAFALSLKPGQKFDESIFAEMGLTIKLEKHTDLMSMSFCGILCAEEAMQ